MSDVTDTITFLGTAGARVTVTKQILASGGAWLDLGGTQILLDPGPGSLVQATKRKFDPTKLSVILLSHKHLDHSGDINIMIEAMTESGRRRQGLVFVPQDAIDDDPVILNYLRNFPEDIRFLSEGSSYTVNDISFKTPVRHRHPVETYGFIFETPRHVFSWISDTRYFEGLPGYYRGELVVVNVVRTKNDLPIDHLSLSETRQIIQEIMPKAAILTHFGMSMWRAKPWELARELTDELGITVIAARDGMKFDLKQLGEK